jgi:hypothetical protein
LIAVNLNGKWGFIDTNDNVIIPPKFKSVRNFKKGISYVQMRGPNNEWLVGCIDKKGKEIIPIKIH